MQKRVMKKKLTAAGGVYRSWNKWTVGDYVYGEYLSTQLDNYDKPGYTIRVEDAHFEDGTSDALIGKHFTLNSNGMLDKAMSQVQFGELIQVTYEGTATMEKGKYAGKESHKVTLESNGLASEQPEVTPKANTEGDEDVPW